MQLKISGTAALRPNLTTCPFLGDARERRISRITLADNGLLFAGSRDIYSSPSTSMIPGSIGSRGGFFLISFSRLCTSPGSTVWLISSGLAYDLEAHVQCYSDNDFVPDDEELGAELKAIETIIEKAHAGTLNKFDFFGLGFALWMGQIEVLWVANDRSIAVPYKENNAVLNGEQDKVVNYESGPEADYAVPTTEHYLPLIYCLGAAAGDRDAVFQHVCHLGSMAMTGFIFG